MRQISLDPDLYRKTQEHAERIGGTVSGIIRVALREYLGRHAQEPDRPEGKREER